MLLWVSLSIAWEALPGVYHWKRSTLPLYWARLSCFQVSVPESWLNIAVIPHLSQHLTSSPCLSLFVFPVKCLFFSPFLFFCCAVLIWGSSLHILNANYLLFYWRYLLLVYVTFISLFVVSFDEQNF